MWTSPTSVSCTGFQTDPQLLPVFVRQKGKTDYSEIFIHGKGSMPAVLVRQLSFCYVLNNNVFFSIVHQADLQKGYAGQIELHVLL